MLSQFDIPLPYYIFGTIFLYIIHRLYRTYKLNALLRSNGCQPAYVFPVGPLPFGLSYIIPIQRAFKVNTFLELMASRFPSHGVKTYSFHVLGMTSIATMEPENFREVLSTGFNNFETGPMRRGNFKDSFGTHGIFTTDGEDWVNTRAILRPQFVLKKERMLGDMKTSFNVSFERFLKKLDLTGETAQDIQPLLLRLKLETSLKFLFGLELEGKETEKGGISVTEKELRDFDWAITGVQSWLAFRHRLQKLYYLGRNAEYHSMIKVLHNFADKVITRCIEILPPSDQTPSEKSPSEGTTPEKYIFLHNLLPLVPREHLRDHTLSLLFAGRDSTSITLSFVLTHLSHNPEIYSQLRTQVLEVYGPTLETLLTKLSEKGHDYTETHPPLLYDCINETHRLHPPVPLNQRYAAKDCTLPRGGGPTGSSPIYLQKGQRVDLNFFALHRDPALWGSDSLEWKPSRWAEMRVGTRRKVGTWEFAPWSGGRRVCLGMGFAKTEMGFLLVRFLQEVVRIEAEGGEEAMKIYREKGVKSGSTLTMFVADGARMRVWGMGK